MPNDKCYYCGNQPVSHRSTRLLNDLTTLGDSVRRPLRRLLGAVAAPVADFLIRCGYHLGKIAGLVTFNDQLNDTVSGRASVLWEEAKRRGIGMRQIVIAGTPIDGFEASVGGKTIRFLSLPIPPKFMPFDASWIDDKAELKRVLESASIPVPQGGRVTTLRQAETIFDRTRKPVIVKPASGSRGRHTTTFVGAIEQLRGAVRIAQQISRDVIVEEHLLGSVYRATVIQGKLVGLLRGDPPRITGTGQQTISQLITMKNENRHPQVSPYVITPLTHEYLARIGYSVDSLLPKGVTIDLTEKIGVRYGGHSAEELNVCHPKTKALFERAAAVVNYPILGFDCIMENAAQDPDTQRWGIIECNSVPFIDLHHNPVEGPSLNVAKHVWDLWETT